MDRDAWNIDEGVTYTLAQQVLEGDVLYRDAADHRSPLVPYLKAAVFAVFGDWNVKAVQVSLLVMIGLMAFGLGWIGLKLGGWTLAWPTAVTACFLQIYWIDVTDALSVNTGWFVIAFSTAAFALFVGSVDRPSIWRGVGVGLLFGGAMLCKQPGLLDMLVALILVGLLAYRNSSANKRDLLIFGTAIAIDTLLPLAGFSIHYWLAGAWDDYIYYAFTFNTEVYVPEVPLGERLTSIQKPFSMLLHNAPLFGFMGIAAAVGLMFRAIPQLWAPKSIELLPWLVLGWSASGLVSTTLSGRDFAHYSEQIIPGLSLAVGWVYSRLGSGNNRFSSLWGRHVQIAIIAVVLVSVVIRNVQIKNTLSGIGSEAHPVALLAAEFSEPDERMFIWGYYPELYLDAKRTSSSRYVYANFLTGLIPWTNLDPLQDVTYAISPSAESKLGEDLSARPPSIIIDTTSLRGYSRFPIEERTTLWTELTENYVQVAADTAAQHRMRLFRRINDAGATTVSIPPREAIEPTLQISDHPDLRPGSLPMIEVAGDSGFEELVLMSGDRVHSSVSHAKDSTLHARFFVPDLNPAAETIWIAARHSDGTWHRSKVVDLERFTESRRSLSGHRFGFEFSRETIVPTAIGSQHPTIGKYDESGERWILHAPAYLRYPQLSGMGEISFVHGISEQATFRSDGYDVSLYHEKAPGDEELIWQRRMQPFKNGQEQYPQYETVELPSDNLGALVFRFTTGAKSNADHDTIYLGEVSATKSRPVFWLGDRVVSVLGGPSISFTESVDNHWLMHAPSSITWTRPDDLMEFSFTYGVDEGAYQNEGQGHTDGVGFELNLIDESGVQTTLWSDYLRPFSNPEDRGHQTASATLPANVSGDLVLTTNAGPSGNKAWDWGYAGDFQARPPGPPIVLPDGRTLYSISQSGYNSGWSDRQSATQWGAQTPQELVYPKPSDLAHLKIRFGINGEAARDENGNRRSDGAQVRVVFLPEQGEPVELFTRLLDPYNHPEDAGMHAAEFASRPGEDGKLLIRMEPGPHEDSSFDWAFWGEFEGVTTQ